MGTESAVSGSLDASRLLRGGAAAASTLLCSASALAAPVYSVTRLEPFSTSSNGTSYGIPQAVGANGDVVGFAVKYVGSADTGRQPVIWRAGGTVAAGLPKITPGAASGEAHGVNGAGYAIGFADSYVNNAYKGNHQHRWSSNGTAAELLLGLGSDLNGTSTREVNALDGAGNAYGSAIRYVNGVSAGARPVRWDVGRTTPTELATIYDPGNLGGSSVVLAVNSGGVAVGRRSKVSETGFLIGARPVRWSADGSSITELATTTSPLGAQEAAWATAINSAGEAAGYAQVYQGSAPNSGYRAVRWPADGTSVVELEYLSVSTTGHAESEATGIDGSGNVVGFSRIYVGTTSSATRATIWPAGGTAAVDLNTLIDPNSGWVLEWATAVNESGMIVGFGTYDPDGPSGKPRLTNQPFRVEFVPEPSGIFGIAVVATVSFVRRRRRRRRETR